MSIQERKADEKQQLRRKIINAARDLCLNEGYDQVSMRKIARKIDYSPTTIYLYFKNKAELLDCVCDETQANLLKTLETLFQDLSDPVETLRKCSRAYADFGINHPEDYKLTFMFGPKYQEDLGLPEGSTSLKMFEYLHNVGKECMDQGKFR